MKAQISRDGDIVVIAENPAEAFALKFLYKTNASILFDLDVVAGKTLCICGAFDDEAEPWREKMMRFCPICKAKIDHNNTAGFNEDRTVYFCPNCGNAIDVMAGNPYGDDN